jgi:hypothetical protein
MPDRGGPVVVKLGGSHALSDDLRAWVAALAACAGRAVVVPGGGPFADAVRAAQPRMGFGDLAAHRMALLAMEQYGYALASLDARLRVADSVESMRCALHADGVPVWLPARMVFDAADVPPSWDVTSDSLAAWLAGKIGAARLMLVKRIALPPHPVRGADLAARGVVDRAFAAFAAASGVPTFVLGAGSHVAIRAAICDDHGIGTPIEVP